jgi:hypothetical protein
MRVIRNWRDEDIPVAMSTGGVIATVDPWHNVVRTGVSPWPPPELIQKLYQSRHSQAFAGEVHVARSVSGFYSDLQSVHSEDAITWSAFGPVIYADSSVRSRFAAQLLEMIGIPGQVEPATLWLWRRLPHPDSLVPGGPEIDFGLQTETVFLLGEAKWRSAVGEGQGVDRSKNQITLRQEFCSKYGQRLLRGVRDFVVLGVSQSGGMLQRSDGTTEGVDLHTRDVTWQQLAGLHAHPCGTELKSYLLWKSRHSQKL